MRVLQIYRQRKRCLEKAGLSLEDIDIFEIHEAFSAQVLATLKVLESKAFAKTFLCKDEPVGKIPLDKVEIGLDIRAVKDDYSW